MIRRSHYGKCTIFNSDIQKVSLTEQKRLFSYLEEILVVGLQVNQVTQEVKEFRFAKGKVYPYCNAETVSRNGKYKGKQRYICKSCNKIFTDYRVQSAIAEENIRNFQ
ncbi:transposase-like protein [Brassicibacter mesophilus]